MKARTARSVMNLVFAPAFLSAFALAGCDAAADGGSATETIVRDSAGVTIVENSSPHGVTPAPLMLSEEPVLEIGVLDGAPEYQLHQVRQAGRLSDGRIFIANGGSSQLRFYDTDGGFLGSVGRQGEGPGEFQSLTFARAMDGDSILVFDNRSRRITIIAPDMSFAHDFTPLGADESAAPLNIVGALAGGTLLARAQMSFMGDGGIEDGFRRDPVNFSIGLPGEEPVQVDPIPGAEMHLRTSTSGGNLVSVQMMGIPYARNALTASGPAHFFLGSNETYEVRRFTADGRLDAIIRSDHVPLRPVTPELVDLHADELIERQAQALGSEPDAAEAATMRESFRDLQRVPSLPVYRSLVADDAARLWVQEYALPGEERESDGWILFDEDGRMLGGVQFPVDFRPLFIDAEVMIGVARDEYDVEYVRVYALQGR